MQLSEFNDATFDSMIDNFVEELWRKYPVKATYKGIHKYDHLLDDVSETALNGFINKQREYAGLCERFARQAELNENHKIDLAILSGYLKADPVYHEKFRQYYRNPSVYISLAISACHILWLRNFAPKEERYTSMIARMRAIPELLAGAKNNLGKADFIPKVWLELGLNMATSAKSFFSDTIGKISGEVPSLKNDLLAAGELVLKAVKDYRKFLENELSAKPDGSFAAGRDLYELLLKESHKLPYTMDELEQIGLQYIEETTNKLDELAREINPNKAWSEVIEEIKNDYPAAEKLLQYYRNEVAATREFIMENKIVSVPENESLDVIETPAFLRTLLPYAGCMIPPPYEVDQRSFFLVTPVDTTASDKKQKEQLSGHSRAAITVRSIHEGYPGHHLQFCHANRIQSEIRKLFGTAVFAEGWALYCEGLMGSAGFYKDKRIELIQLKDQLWRACRVVIDVRLHTQKCTFDEAVNMLVDTARLEVSNARAEVRRYTQDPTQPMSYLIGKIEIERLLNDIRAHYPEEPIGKIHDRLLSYGTIPVVLVRQAMLGTN